MRTLVRGGTVVTATDVMRADVLLDGEQIAAVGVELPDEGVDAVLDATDRYVVPGGIDAHTHLDMPFGGTQAADDFETGTRAAAHGGTTCIVDFAIQPPGGTPLAGLEEWHGKAEGRCAIDYAFHMIYREVNDTSLKEMDALIDEGVTSFKLFMAYPGVFFSTDGEIFRAMQQSATNGGLIMMHAENGLAIDVLVEQALARGLTAPVQHGLTRPSSMEGEATHRAIRLAALAGSPVYIVHLSAAEALEEVAEARAGGHNVFAETCPQYLFLTLDDLDRPGFEGAKYVCSPPLREASHHERLWTGLRRNDLQVVSTDHCPFCFVGQKDLGKDDFSKIPNGLPGIEHRLDLLHDGGVVAGHFDINRWVEICATTPAKMFGLYPQKGTIAVGSDADLVIYNPAARQVLSAESHHMAVDYSCYEGREIAGRAETVLSRGKMIIRDGDYVGQAGDGRFTKRDLSNYLA